MDRQLQLKCLNSFDQHKLFSWKCKATLNHANTKRVVFFASPMTYHALSWYLERMKVNLWLINGLCQATCHDLSLQKIAVFKSLCEFWGVAHFCGPFCRLPVGVVKIFQTFLQARFWDIWNVIFVEVLVARYWSHDVLKPTKQCSWMSIWTGRHCELMQEKMLSFSLIMQFVHGQFSNVMIGLITQLIIWFMPVWSSISTNFDQVICSPVDGSVIRSSVNWSFPDQSCQNQNPQRGFRFSSPGSETKHFAQSVVHHSDFFLEPWYSSWSPKLICDCISMRIKD